MDKFRKGYFKLYFKPDYFFRMADRRKKYVRTSEGKGEYTAVVIQPLNKKLNVKTWSVPTTDKKFLYMNINGWNSSKKNYIEEITEDEDVVLIVASEMKVR